MKINDVIYFDHQATTPVSGHIFSKMLPYYRESFGNPHSSEHTFGWNSSSAVENAADQVAQLIGADADEIVFTSGATESNNLALIGLSRGRRVDGRRRRLIVSAIEHKCVLEISRNLSKELDLQVELIPVNPDGQICLEKLEQTLDDDVLAVSIMAVNNEIGTVQDIKSISRIVRAAGALLHCDAAQAPLAIDMSDFASQVDLLSLSGHKMYGPKGIGALYVRRDLFGSLRPILYGGNQQGGLRPGTLPTPLCVGIGAAAEFMGREDTISLRNKLRELRDYFSQKLIGLNRPISINGPDGKLIHPGNLSVCFHHFSASDILQILQPHLCASTGSACTSGTLEPSHVLKAIGRSTQEAESTIRFSLGFDTTLQDVDEAVALISQALNKFSDFSSASAI